MGQLLLGRGQLLYRDVAVDDVIGGVRPWTGGGRSVVTYSPPVFAGSVPQRSSLKSGYGGSGTAPGSRMRVGSASGFGTGAAESNASV